ncbi:MAG: hypothetical protein JWP78_2312 [Mucilaginibacter sp.]|nr:hypothetical protein [Mucilaginibacter sp.]
MPAIDYQEFILNWDNNIGEIDFNLTAKDSNEMLIDLKLAPLWDTEEEKERGQVYDIPRHLFREGDYYQAATQRHTAGGRFPNRSLLATIHEIILSHSGSLSEIRNIYSASDHHYQEEVFITAQRNGFWAKQLAKAGEIPVSYEEMDNRYKLVINA